jgi:hypothetical protein
MLSNNNVKRHIQDLSTDIETQLVSRTRRISRHVRANSITCTLRIRKQTIEDVVSKCAVLKFLLYPKNYM